MSPRFAYEQLRGVDFRYNAELDVLARHGDNATPAFSICITLLAGGGGGGKSQSRLLQREFHVEQRSLARDHQQSHDKYVHRQS